MASVFLSYDREDADRARSIALALEKAGHSVWWDRHIKGGAQFSKAIEDALKAAEAVVVLWSEHSVDSAWVRDEAAAGRDSGRLVPVLIDDTEPPLGFRQYQTIDLSAWNGRSKSAELGQLLGSINDLGNARPAAPTIITPSKAAARTSSRRMLLPLIVAVVLLTAGFAAWHMVGRGNGPPTIAVAAADASPSTRTLTRDLLVKLGSLQSSRGESMRLIEGNGTASPGADLIFEASANGPQTEANLVLLSGNDQTILWSEDFMPPSGNPGDLKQQLAYTAAQVLACALEGLSSRGRRLDQQTLKLYLRGCAAYADKTSDNLRTILPLFLKLTRTAPDFAGGWAKLLLVESDFASMSYLPESARIVAPLAAHIGTARKLDPNMPEAFLAEAALVPEMSFERRIGLLEHAAKEGPDNAAILAVLSDNLLAVGRMNEAVEHAQRAVQANPLSPTARDSLVAALTYAGKFDAALAELLRAEQLWPGASSVVTARFRINLRYGNPREAMRLIRSREISTANTPYTETFLEARIRPTPANIDRAVSEARSYYDSEPTVIYHLAQVLGTFGREEELFPILLNWQYPDKVSYVVDVLFRPALRNVQRDPRMIAISKRLGLLDYWQKSGQWPDICSEPDLPYDCKEEAAKIAA